MKLSRRRAALAIPAYLSLGALGACKRQRAPKVNEVWDEQPAVEHTEALASLAPPWPAPTRARLDNGLLTLWLQEPLTPAAHLRVFLPTHGAKILSADSVSVIAEYLRFELQRRTAREGAQVEIAHGADRLELALHGRDEDLPALLQWLGWVLRSTPPIAGLERAQDRVAEKLGDPGSLELALSALAATLLDRDPANLQATTAGVRALERDRLAKAWARATDPRRAVLVVHAGREAEAARAELRRLSDAWFGLGKAAIEEDAVARLRPPPPQAPRAGRLLAEPAEPLTLVAGGRGRPELVLGRVVATPTAADRSLARLAQRILQEEIDARLHVAGPVAIFIATTRLSGDSPDRSATDLVDTIAAAATTRQPAQRLFSAAELWLGARVVHASLHGEDWTALFSESLDLAGDDADLGSALARDAAAMLEPDAEALRTWQARWLHPRAGEPGWRWVAAGTDRKLERRLERIVPLR